MKLTLHIFQKDVRHLWREILLVLIALALLTWADLVRYDRLPTALEGILNLLLPVAWFCLLAMLVYSESLIGDRQLWFSWPYSWSSLLAAKLLFALAVVHLPYLISGVVILAGHRIPLIASLPALLERQWLLAALLTLPALALASITRSLAQFILAAMAVIVAGLAAAGGPVRFDLQIDHLEGQRLAITAGTLLTVSLLILIIQYPFRRLAIARLTAILGLLCCTLIATMPPRARSLPPSKPAPVSGSHVELQFEPERLPPTLPVPDDYPSQLRVLRLPLRVHGVPPGAVAFITFSLARMKTPAGLTIASDLGRMPMEFKQDRPGWITLRINAADYDSIRDTPISLTIDAEASLVVPTTLLRLPARNGNGWHPMLGRCRTALVLERRAGVSVRALCEATREPAAVITVRLENSDWFPATFNTTWDYPNYPTRTWLSPLYRSQAPVGGPSADTMVRFSSTRSESGGDVRLTASNVILSRYQVVPLPEPSARTLAK